MEKRVAIIGAGISGLLACKYTLNKGFKPTVFEAEARIGGIWARTMESTRLQNTRELYQFSDFPWPSSVKDLHPTHTQVIEYLESYAEFFKIFPCIKFNSKVIGIDYVGESFQEMESWDLWGGNGKAFGSKGKWHIKVQETKNGRLIKEYDFEFVILCIGQFSGYPNIPEFPPNKGPEVFKGKVKHSMDFSALDNMTVANLVEGKRVAIIGFNKSGADIAAECANTNGVKYPCTVIQRTARWFMPSTFFCGLLFGFLYANRFSQLLVHKPGETFLLALLATLLSPLRWANSKVMETYIRWNFPLKKYGMLPKRRFDEDFSTCQMATLSEKFFEKLEEGSIFIKNSKSVGFCNEGLVIDGEAQPLEVDVVIYATGFKGHEKLKIIFESSVFQEYIQAAAPVLLYRQVLHPRIPQLGIIGYNESLSNLGNSEMKSMWLAHFLDGSLKLPCIREMEKEAKMWGDHIRKYTGRYYKRACINDTGIWYNDQICKDMGYNPRRKNGFLSDLFIPYAPTDYAGLTIK